MRETDFYKKIALNGRSLLLAWSTWHKDTAEHQQARDKIIDDFVKDILALFTESLPAEKPTDESQIGSILHNEGWNACLKSIKEKWGIK